MPAQPSPITPLSALPSDAPDRRGVLVAALLLVLAIALGYANSLSGPFVYDDYMSIPYNPTIRALSADVLRPPGDGATVSGRPVLNLSFALNYAIGGLDVQGYHLVNVAIHACAALALLGLFRRTFFLAAPPDALRRHALPVAAALAAIWALHPLQTESVTYLVQRAESLMGMFYLLTLYAFVRSTQSTAPFGWRLAAWVACALGMATKENMVSAPLLVLLYDRAFVGGSFAAAWRARRGFYLALAATWLLLAALVLTTGGNRGGSAGFDVGINFVPYVLTQIPAFVRYACLCVWPYPLVFDYGAFFVQPNAAFFLQATVVAAFLVGTGWSLIRFPKLGVLGFLALAVLAPTSLIPGTTQMVVEHRLYLPLAAAVALLAPLVRLGRPVILGPLAVLIVVALGGATAARNRVYQTEVGLWADTVAKAPANTVARSSYGAALAGLGRRSEALREHLAALALNPEYVPALANVGLALSEMGRPADALPYLTRAVELSPRKAAAHLNLGITLGLLNRSPEALAHFAEAVQLNPLLPAAHNNYGDALCRSGQVAEGLHHLDQALALQPDYVEAHLNRAAALVRLQRMPEARTAFATAIRLKPGDAAPYISWANFLLNQGQLAEALAAYESGLQLKPDAADARYSYATALARAERYADAVSQFEATLRLRPDDASAHNNLANSLAALDRVADAIPHYEAALKLRPDDARTHDNLGLALARSGRLAEAAKHFATAVRLDPSLTEAREHLSRAQAQEKGLRD
ncbi:tetratricopeptide repeat protein [Opitutus sp. ER46]|uniref:tetratricopeptide repeat protein n=1 Tax=Opitutus sp. ER46 TaxID=2161864 RepID=UPI000D308892|nr:tetratricopeptide repeat protein [Opitutus sp. ER46]